MSSSLIRVALVIVVLLCQEDNVTGLQLLGIQVPKHVPLGMRPSISCRWRLSPMDVLYCVKWYKDAKEFFTYLPRDSVKQRKYLQPGVDVLESTPNASNLTLYPAVLATGGRYRCEITCERPLFHTVTEYSDMIVVVLPSADPIITGSHTQYQIGDRVRATCTSGRSQPATNLSWYINGEPAHTAIVREPKHYKHEDGLETTSLALEFKAKPKHFRKGDLKLKCFATIGIVYWRSCEKSIQMEKFKTYEGGSRADRSNIILSVSMILILVIVRHLPTRLN